MRSTHQAAAPAETARDDRVLPYVRALSAVIIPFLLLAFVVLYMFPADTGRLFAWTIRSRMTAMTLASAYLGGAYFFTRVLWIRRWHTISVGFAAVALFASLLGVATILHWETFRHSAVAFWLWVGLYFTTPFLVIAGWVTNSGYATPSRPDELRLGRARWVVAIVGLSALVQGVVMFLVPAAVIPLWPWPLTPLTCRVVGSIFCLGCAGLVSLVDPRWTRLRLMLQVEAVMIISMLVAAARARAEFSPERPLTWLLLAGFLAVLAGSVFLWWSMESRGQRVGDAVRD
jgi:hypothetical protein